MIKLKKSRIVLITLFAIFAILLYLLSAVRITAFDGNMYAGFFRANNIYNELPDASERAENLLNYIKGGREINASYFNEREISHLEDVRGLFSLSSMLLFLSMVFCLAIMGYSFFKKDLPFMSACLIAGGAATLAVIIIISIMSLRFEWLFVKFHELLFSNNLWLMNPSTDKIIILLPESFFKMAAKRIFLTAGALSFGMLAAGLTVKYMEKKLNNVLQ
ncbi:MAG: TIGR01906 family membrane protein [Nanoarchaeota archaeon]